MRHGSALPVDRDCRVLAVRLHCDHNPLGEPLDNLLAVDGRGFRGVLLVHANELAHIAQHSFFGLGVADTRDAVMPLAPFREADRLSLALFGRFRGKDDLKQPPHIRQRHAGLGFFPPDGAVAGPGTKVANITNVM